MITLFYHPGASSLAPHIALEEANAVYTTRRVLLNKKEQREAWFLEINPRGRLPVLVVDGKVISENLAILTWISLAYPDAQLLPSEPEALVQALSLMSHFASAVHPAHAHIGRPDRYVDDTTLFPVVQEKGRETFKAYLTEIDGLLGGRDWILGEYSVCDAYALVFYLWGIRRGLGVAELANYSAHATRMLARPAVSRVIRDEEITELG